jgi:hypothetical protein
VPTEDQEARRLSRGHVAARPRLGGRELRRRHLPHPCLIGVTGDPAGELGGDPTPDRRAGRVDDQHVPEVGRGRVRAAAEQGRGEHQRAEEQGAEESGDDEPPVSDALHVLAADDGQQLSHSDLGGTS